MGLLPVIQGVIKRRLLINFRAEPEVVQRILPPGFRPKLHCGQALVGICLIRLEEMRPNGLPSFLGFSSENAAHRMAVEWTGAGGESREGVFVPRRDTDSAINALAGGRLFSSEQHLARFAVEDDGRSVSLAMSARDKAASLAVKTREADELPSSSIFSTVAEASEFFEGGKIGFSPNGDRLKGIALQVRQWQVAPIEVTEVTSAFFEDRKYFPAGSVHFDHGLIMRDLQHEWHGVRELVPCPAASAR